MYQINTHKVVNHVGGWYKIYDDHSFTYTTVIIM